MRLMFRRHTDHLWKARLANGVSATGREYLREAMVALWSSGEYRAVVVTRDGKMRIREVGRFPDLKSAKDALAADERELIRARGVM